MAIKTVNAENLASYVAEKRAGGSEIATHEQAAVQEAKVTEGTGTGPIVGTVTETVSTAPDPGPQKEGKPGDDEDDDKGEAKPPSWYRKTLDRLKREKEDLDEFARGEYDARVQLQERLKQLEAAQPKPEVKKVERPDRTKYKPEEAEKYENDLLDWNRKQAIAEFQEQEQQRQLNEKLKTAADAARAELSDFDDVIRRGAQRAGNVPAYVQGAIYQAEGSSSAYLAYHIAKFPEEASRIFAMPPYQAVKALAKIEEQYTKKPGNGATSSSAVAPAKESAPVAPISKAPPPVASLTAGSGDIVLDVSKITGADYPKYKRYMLEQKRLGRRR